MPIPSSLQKFWNDFDAATDAVDITHFFEVRAFRHSKHLVNELAALVLSGIKRATAGSVWSYETDGKRLPRRAI